jgi:hypothetical protein
VLLKAGTGGREGCMIFSYKLRCWSTWHQNFDLFEEFDAALVVRLPPSYIPVRYIAMWASGHGR